MWGLDLLRPFKKAPGGRTHLLVTVDKFTKWIEARPMAKIGSMQAVSFVQDIIFCFGVPNSIIIDNGTLFIREKFMDFYDDNTIQVDWAAVTHPWKNGQVERTDDLIL
jgi:IS30 family transposase